MKISKQSRRDAKQLFRGCLVNGILDENRARQVVQLLVSNKPRGYEGILSHFHRLIKFDVARRTAIVESAAPLTDALRQAVKENLSRAYGQGLTITFKENPGLIGGLRVQVGSDVFDGSVRARLGDLQESF